MNVTLGTVAAASLAVFAVSIGSCGPSSAASRTACDVLSASQASAVIGSPVTAQGINLLLDAAAKNFAS